MASISVATCSTTTVMPMRVSWKDAPGDWRQQRWQVAFVQTFAILARPQVHDVWMAQDLGKPLDSSLRHLESMHRPEARRQCSLPKTAAEAVEAVRGEPRGTLVVGGTPHENPGCRPKNRASPLWSATVGTIFATRASLGRWRSGDILPSTGTVRVLLLGSPAPHAST